MMSGQSGMNSEIFGALPFSAKTVAMVAQISAAR